MYLEIVESAGRRRSTTSLGISSFIFDPVGKLSIDPGMILMEGVRFPFDKFQD